MDRANFDLFISYATAPDHRLVRALEPFLESFHKLRTPRQIALRPINVCVDSSDFASRNLASGQSSTTDQVPAAIQENLSQAAELLVLCSRAASISPWVDLEIKWFLEHRGPGAIRLAVTEGIDPDKHPEDVFPRRIIDAGLHKGLWYDFRAFRRKEAADWLKVRDFDDARTRLAADILDLPAGTIQPIWFREQQRNARRKRNLAVAVSVVMALLAGAAALGLREARQQRDIAVTREVAARENLASAFEERGDRAWQSHDLPAARLLYAKAVSLSDHPSRRMKEMTARLWGARLVWQTPSLTLGHSASALPNGSVAVGNEDGTVHVWELADMRRVASFPGPGTRVGILTISASPHRRPVTVAAASPNGSWLASADAEGTILVWKRHSGERYLELHAGGKPLRSLVVSDSGERVVSLAEDGVAAVWDATGRETGPRFDDVRDVAAVTSGGGPDAMFLSLSADGKASLRSFEDSSVQHTLDLAGRRVAAIAQAGSRRTTYAITTDGMLVDWDTDRGGSNTLVHLPARDPTALSVSEDGQVAATVDRSGTITFWSIQRGIKLFTLPGSDGRLTGPALSRDGARMALLRDGRLEAWDIREARRIGTATGHQAKIRAMAFDPTDGRLASAADDGTVRLWDAIDRTSVLLPQVHSGNVSAVAFDPHGGRLATGGKDGLVVLWNLRSSDSPQKLAALPSEILSLAFSPDGEWLAMAQERGSARAVGLTRDGSAVDLGPATSVAFSPDGATMALGGRDRVSWRSFPDGSRGKTFQIEGTATQVAFDQAGEFVLGASIYGARAWYLDSGQPVKRITDAAISAPVAIDEAGILIGAANAGIVLSSLDPAGPEKLMSLPTSGSGADALVLHSAQHLLAVASESSISFWSLHDALEERTLRVGQAPIQHVAFSPDGAHLATLEIVETENRTTTRLRLFDATSRAPWLVYPEGRERTVVISPGAHYTVAFDREMRRLAWGGSADHVFVLAQSGTSGGDRKLAPRAGSLGGWDIAAPGLGDVNALAFSPDGSILAFAGESRFIHLWDVASNAELGRGLEVRPPPEAGTLTITTPLVGGLAFSTDGSVLAATEIHSGAVSLWDVSSRTRVATVPRGPKRESQELVALDERRFVIADGAARTATVWDVRGERRLGSLRFSHDVNALSLSADGTRLLASGTHGFTVWDMARATPIAGLATEFFAIGRAALSPDGQRVAVADWRLGRVRVWEIAALDREAKRSATQVLSAALRETGHELQGLSPTLALHQHLRPESEPIATTEQRSGRPGK